MATVIYPLPVGGVNHPNKRIRFFKVVLPVCSQSFLTAHVPYLVSMSLVTKQDRCSTYVEFVSLKPLACSSLLKSLRLCIPVILDCLDNKSQSWADAVHVFVHDLLHNRRLSRIVETPAEVSLQQTKQ